MSRKTPETLSKPQYDLLMFIATYMWEHGYQPLQSEMGNHLGISGVGARHLLIKLELKGYIKRVNKKIHLVHLPGFPYARQIAEKMEHVA